MNFVKHAIKTISILEIKEEDRIRQDLGDIKSLAKSIDELGLMYPIMVTSEYVLVDGGRRLAAIKLLGWPEIPVMVVEWKK